jgi:hypothetical protein
MVNKSYKTVQIPLDDFNILREYCEFYNLKIGKYLGGLIQKNCSLVKKPSQGKVLLVDVKE